MPRLIALISLVLTVPACIFGTDDPPPTVCGGAPVICADDCCTIVTEPTYEGCSAFCSGGLRLIGGLTCSPLAACFVDGGPPPRDGGGCGAVDAGAICLGGPCCDDAVHGATDPFTCAFECPRGFSESCTPEPSCAAETVCAQPSECVLTDATCCGTCGTRTLDDVVGVHSDDASRFVELLCADPMECPPCVVGDPNPALIPTCNATMCRAVDLARLPATQCSVDDDCQLRSTECCECGATLDDTNLIGIRPDGVLDLLTLVCDDEATCDACAPDYPADREAFCDAGRCGVRPVP